MTIRVTIDGNIGVGKSTVLEGLRAKLAHEPALQSAIVLEPVNDWVAYGFLEKMYEGKISPYEFQNVVMISMAAALARASTEQPSLVITERSVESSFEVFGTVTLDKNTQSFAMLEYAQSQLTTLLPVYNREHHIYLQLSPKEAFRRVSKRERSAEKGTTETYLEKVADAYNEWLATKHDTNKTIIDANRNIEEVVADVWKTIQKLL